MKDIEGEGEEMTTVWRAVSRFLWWAVIILALCVGLALFKPQMNRQAKLDARLDALKAERGALRAQQQALRARLDWVKHDPAYLENFIRDRLDLARDGETVIRFPAER